MNETYTPNERALIKEHGLQWLGTYRALKASGDTHGVAMTTIAGEKLMANFNR